MHRGRMRGMAQPWQHVAFGDFGLQALGPCWMTARQIEAGRRAITRYVRRGGKIWIRVYPDKPITKKPLEVRQGSGKGPGGGVGCVVRPGRIIYEISGVAKEDGARSDAPRRRTSCRSRHGSCADRRTSMAKKLKTKTDDIRKLSDADLRRSWRRRTAGCSRCGSSGRPASSRTTSEIPKMRRHIARLKTIQRQRELASRPGAGVRA